MHRRNPPRRAKRKRSSAAAAVNNDLLIEIFGRLPKKSLIRFGCVSKSWSDLISHVSSRRRVLLPISGFYFYPSDHGYPDLQYIPISSEDKEEDERDYRKSFDSFLISRIPNFSNMELMHSCNGLLLFTSSHLRNNNTAWERSYSVFNPTTWELVDLPDPPMYGHPASLLAFDPQISPFYKVVRFCSGVVFSKDYLIVGIYSSMTRKWIEINFPQKPAMLPFHWHHTSILHKGTIHMIQVSQKHLVRFDAEEGNFLQELSLPDECRKTPMSNTCIGNSRGHLFFAMNFSSRTKLKIWMLHEPKADQYHWHLTHSMSTTKLFEHRDLEPDHVFPIAFHPDSELLFVSVRYKILAYHTCSGKFSEISRLTGRIALVDWSKFYPVFACLESINPPGRTYIHPNRLAHSCERYKDKVLRIRKGSRRARIC